MTRALGDFVGEYDVSRVIDDVRAGAQSRFEGQARVTPDDDGATYRETGALIVNGDRFQAERTYLWRPIGARITVLFADGAPFHDFDPVQGGDATEHLCGQDLYRGGYDFSQWSRWAVTWDVSGPRKEYRSVTWYMRR